MDERDLGLAYALAAGADPKLRRRAYELLQKVEGRDPEDVTVLIQLAQPEFRHMGAERRAFLRLVNAG